LLEKTSNYPRAPLDDELGKKQVHVSLTSNLVFSQIQINPKN
jgi:hypothetical protein